MPNFSLLETRDVEHPVGTRLISAAVEVDGRKATFLIPPGLPIAQQQARIEAAAQRCQIGQEVSPGILVEEVSQTISSRQDPRPGGTITRETQADVCIAVRTQGVNLYTVVLTEAEYQAPGWVTTLLSRVPQTTATRWTT